MSNPSPPPSSGGSSWLIILLVILGLVMLTCAGLCGGCIYLGQRAAVHVGKAAEEFAGYLQLMPAFAATQQAVDNDPQVVQRLGQPIESLAMPKRQNQGDLKPGGETFLYDIRGPQGTAIVSGVATAESPAGPWRVSTINVTFADGSVVTVPTPENQPAGGTFEFQNTEIQLPPELHEPIETK
ncbi:MAG TPA: cytochrome c oxidase assembly factor Coa1 family protein [Pirellulaceae bacterium]|nr:cytochrome c oxidase assembly factor Coa1 family protein [Pirellulaceae bacterium]